MEDLRIIRKSLNRQPHFLRLSRMKDELISMIDELHSYRCEPCTPDMYEQYVAIESRSSRLKHAIDKTIYSVQDSVKTSTNMDEEINEIVMTYHKFQKEFSIYISEAMTHH